MLNAAAVSAEHTDRLVAYFPAVTVGAVEKIPRPALPDAGDGGQLVQDTGREQDPPRRQLPAAGQVNDEPGLDSDHPISTSSTP